MGSLKIWCRSFLFDWMALLFLLRTRNGEEAVQQHTFPQNSTSVVEQSSGRQVTLNCHCEGHLVVYKSTCIVFC